MFKNTRSSKKKSKGFTIIVVVVIPAIIIGIFTYVQQSRVNTDINNANAMQKAIGTLSTDKEANQALSSLGENEELTITWKDEQKIENGKISAVKSTEENATVNPKIPSVVIDKIGELISVKSTEEDATVDPEIPPLIIDKIGELFPDGLPSSKTGNYFHLIIKKLDDTDTQYKVTIDGPAPSNPDDSGGSGGTDPSNPSNPSNHRRLSTK